MSLTSSFDPLSMVDGSGGAIGMGQVANEYWTGASIRAKEFMQDFAKRPDPIHAALVEKLVELTIDLHPHKELLARPVDELLLGPAKGVEWLQKKPNCSKDPKQQQKARRPAGRGLRKFSSTL